MSVVGVKSTVIMGDINTISEFRSTQSALFLPLLTSDGGTYSCYAGYDIPQAGLSHIISSTTATVVVQSKYNIV